ncbi:response regulator [Corynebacterium epidermidicanis]|uniref:Two component transcriptional regulator, LuxR family n=1 Tax=Corynebacterium epidermidicanis TaxID=1050174 RepID=A0A0G3GMX1_9CORY|nr:response regulator transcription factor [Corynebacterium epidermidicanis]AKK02494.1 two component transcriptional regulator, LuxR family [Corynebacterium epidermidicanis]
MIRVLLVDDQPLIRQGLKAIFEATGEITVVAEAASGNEAIAKARDVDVVCMDIRMPDGDGIYATTEINKQENPPAIIVITTFDLDEYVFGALEAGACGVMLKDSPMADLIEGVKRAASGEGMVDAAVTKRVIAEFGRRKARAVVDSELLTARELDCVRALGQGLTNIEIGRELYLEPSTVKTHLSSAMAKVGASSRVQLVIWAFRAGVVS